MQYLSRFMSATLIMVILSWLAGCGRQTGEIEILCGNSFRAPMEELAKMYEQETGHRVEMSFAGSEALLPSVELKAAGDVFVTHSPYQEYTQQAGALLREVQVGYLAPVLVVGKGNPKNVKRIEDLAQEGLKVVLPDPEFASCGKMVFKLLEKKGIKEQVLKNVGNDLVRDHSQVGNQLKLGARDAGIMWNGVAHEYRDALEIVPTPYEYDETTRVSVMGLSYSKKQEELKEFLDFVEEHGQKVFSDFGYVKEVVQE
jgi:molybdate transport system substrate-binding protein